MPGVLEAAEPGDPVPLNGQATGWLQPWLTGVAEACAREGAAASVLQHHRLPTPAEARRGIKRTPLAFQPVWLEHVERLEGPANTFGMVALVEPHWLDDDPEALYLRLDGAAQLQPAAMATFVHGLSTPMLLVLKLAMDKLDAKWAGWDQVAPA